jgi:tRNA threonylcarbamoyladenosine biosynthesis protein TsaE
LTTTHAPQETAALGECLGRVLERGDVVLLSGELGAGKTVFAQGLGRGLGTPTLVRSSSFVLLSEHAEGRLPLFHADLYRLADSEVADLFLDEEAADGVLLVEWPERWEEGAPADHLRIQFDTNLDAGADPPQKITDDRTIILTARGPASGALLQRFLNPDRGPN